MVRGGGDAEEEARRTGLPKHLVEQAEGFKPAWIYQDQARVVSIFSDMLTQWRMGPSGPIGLDYSALEAVMRIRDVGREDQGAMLTEIQIMERAALQALRE